MGSVEHQPITGVWGQSHSWVQKQSPWSGILPEAERVLHYHNLRNRDQFVLKSCFFSQNINCHTSGDMPPPGSASDILRYFIVRHQLTFSMCFNDDSLTVFLSHGWWRHYVFRLSLRLCVNLSVCQCGEHDIS